METTMEMLAKFVSLFLLFAVQVPDLVEGNGAACIKTIKTVDPCEGVQCTNGGTCNENDGTCDCLDLFSGVRCQNGPCEAPGTKCSSRGTCYNYHTYTRGFYCQCYDDYYGDDCEKFLNPEDEFDFFKYFQKVVSTHVKYEYRWCDSEH